MGTLALDERRDLPRPVLLTRLLGDKPGFCGDGGLRSVRFAGGVVLARVPAGRELEGFSVAPLETVWYVS